MKYVKITVEGEIGGGGATIIELIRMALEAKTNYHIKRLKRSRVLIISNEGLAKAVKENRVKINQ